MQHGSFFGWQRSSSSHSAVSKGDKSTGATTSTALRIRSSCAAVGSSASKAASGVAIWRFFSASNAR
jgi:hypothetical protein